MTSVLYYLQYIIRNSEFQIKPEKDKEAVAVDIHKEDISLNRRLGDNGAHLLEGGVLTVCNTGALATGGHGTALGMVRSALAQGRSVHVYACETRPYNQGARLTTWECVQVRHAVYTRPCLVKIIRTRSPAP